MTAGPGAADSQWPRYRTLRRGQRVRLDLGGPADRDDLLEGFRGLSPRSRYLRFFTGMPELPPRVVDGLLRTDASDHVAVGARLIGADGTVLPPPDSWGQSQFRRN
jgi:hypothetical protein